MKRITEDLVVLGLGIFLLPLAITLAIWALVYGIFLIPLLTLGWLIWRYLKNKGYLHFTIPETATVCSVKEPHKPKMVKWYGKEVPLGVFIRSAIFSVIATPIVLYLLIFWVPPIITVLIMGYTAGKAIGKRIKNK